MSLDFTIYLSILPVNRRLGHTQAVAQHHPELSLALNIPQMVKPAFRVGFRHKTFVKNHLIFTADLFLFRRAFTQVIAYAATEFIAFTIIKNMQIVHIYFV